MKKIMIKLGLKMLDAALLKWLLKEYVFPAIDKFVASTKNKYDDKAAKHIKNFLSEMCEII